jgi:hypothetical protein
MGRILKKGTVDNLKARGASELECPACGKSVPAAVEDHELTYLCMSHEELRILMEEQLSLLNTLRERLAVNKLYVDDAQMAINKIWGILNGS